MDSQSPTVGCKESTKIQKSMQRLSKQIDVIGNSVSDLSVGLNSIMTPQAEGTGAGPDSPPKPLECQMVADLDELSDNLTSSIRVLSNIMGRIEL